MKVTNLVEQIFAQAVALDQSGGLKNTIYVVDNEILIMNYDHTVLLRFRLRKSEGTFEQAISFKANDYDSNTFDIKDGKIVFYSEKGEYQRKKICGTADITPDEVREIYRTYAADDGEHRQSVVLSKDVLELLDEDLSHVEFIGEVGKPIKMIQRNIFSGGIIEITKESKGFFSETIAENFGPIAIKTGDFKALFTFQDSLKFMFPNQANEDFILVRSMDENKRSLNGVIACCIYDEIIALKEARNIQAEDEETVKPKLKRSK